MKNNYELKISIGNIEDSSGILFALYNKQSEVIEQFFLLEKVKILTGLKNNEHYKKDADKLRDDFKVFLKNNSDVHIIHEEWVRFKKELLSLTIEEK